MTFLLRHKLVIGAALSAIVIALLIVVGGSKSKEKAPAATPPPANVEVAQVESQNVPIYSEWIGSLDGMVNAEIRAQVTGYLLRQSYKEGSFVRKGQLLFEIDPRPFQAALDQAKGDLARAQAQLAQGDDIVPIPGTKRRNYLEENAGAVDVTFSIDELAVINALFPPDTAAGARYPEAMMKMVNR